MSNTANTINTTNTTKIAILGAGAIGTYVGGRLLTNKNQVTFIGREPLKQAIENKGLTISDNQGYKHVYSPQEVDMKCCASALENADIILVAVKSKDTLQAAKQIKEYASANAIVISFQNGISNKDILSKTCSQHVLAGVVPFGVVWSEGSHFHQAVEGQLIIESDDSSQQTIQQCFEHSGFPVAFSKNISTVMWSKLLLNMNNAINALCGVPLLTGLQNRQYRKAVAACMNEALSVMSTAGIASVKVGKTPVSLVPTILCLPNFLFNIVASSMIKISPTARSSMLDDIEQGREPEVNYINGEVVKLAKLNNMTAPINNKVTSMILDAHNQNKGSPNIELNTIYKRITS